MELRFSHYQRKDKLMFPSSIQNKVNWFVFFLAFPAIDVLSFSITFYFFLVLIIQCGFFWNKFYPGKHLFIGFLIAGTLSTIFTPVSEVFENLNFIKMLIQFYYWIGVASFFIIYFHLIDLKALSKWVLYGLVTYTIAFYFIGINTESSLLSITCTPGRNAYVFVVLACAPISFFFLQDQKWTLKLFFAVFLLTAMLASNGRAGSIIILIELLIVSMIIFPIHSRISGLLIPFFLFLFILTQSAFFEVYKYSIAAQVEPINPRFSSLIRGEGEGDLERDKSWLIRKLMIDKGEEIFYKYPFLGVGPANFKNYRAELKTFTKYDYLQNAGSKTFQMNTSPHNTYLQALSEFGLFGSLFFLIILVKPLWFMLRSLFKNKLTVWHLFLASLLGMCIHFYVISSLTGALPWFIIGLSWAVINQFKTTTK
jgi:O-antigen ligase